MQAVLPAPATATITRSLIRNPFVCSVQNVSFCRLKKLLENNAEKAKQIIAEYKPIFASKEAYLAYVDAFNDSGDRIQYNEDGTASVRIDK